MVSNRGVSRSELVLPFWSFLVLPSLFFEFLVFSPVRISLFFERFPISRDFRGSEGIKNACLFVVFLSVLQKKQGEEGQGPCLSLFALFGTFPIFRGFSRLVLFLFLGLLI